MPSELMTQRLFFALWPDDKTRAAIADIGKLVAQSHYGKPMRMSNLHLTLAFLGNVDEVQREYVETAAASLSMTSFSLCLDHLDIFSRVKVLWLGVKKQPDALMDLIARLSDNARDCGIKLDDKIFNPHVSLMRKVNQLHPLEIKSIDWQVEKFYLLKSIAHPEGIEYQVVKSWPC